MRTNGANGSQVGLDCLTDGHLFIDWKAQGDWTIRQKTDPPPAAPVEACWCIWCGTGVHNGDRDYTDRTPT